MNTTLSFLVPTHREDRPLRRCLDSIAHQLGPQDEVIVVGDTTDGPLPGVARLVNSYGGRYRYLAHPSVEHTWGHAELNWAMPQAQGDFLHLCDDDDVWSMEAVALIRRGVQAALDRPHLFRFRHYNGLTYWLQPGLFERDFIGGHCLVAPNIPGKVGKFGPQYNGDFDWLESTVNAFGGPTQAIWHNQIVAIARPS